MKVEKAVVKVPGYFFFKNKVAHKKKINKFIKNRISSSLFFRFSKINAKNKLRQITFKPSKRVLSSRRKFRKRRQTSVFKFFDFNIFRLFLSTYKNNPKKFTSTQTQNFLINKLKRRFFIKKKDFIRLKRIISNWYTIINYSNIEYFYKIQSKTPRYRKIKRQKSNKRLKFFNFFIKPEHIISRVKFFYANFLEKLLFYNFRLRHFWYKKKILLFFFKKVYGLKKVYINSFNKKINKNSMKKFENRLDLGLVRLGFFKSINFSRIAISRGLIFVNHKKIYNFNFLLNNKDIVHVSWNGSFIFEKFIFENHIFSDNNQKFFVFKKRNKKFLKKTYIKFIFNFFKKNILLFKTLVRYKNSRNVVYSNSFTSNFFFFVLICSNFLRKPEEYKKLNYNFFKFKNIDFLVHNHF